VTIWAMARDVPLRVAHAFISREAYDTGRPALCGKAVECSEPLKRGMLARVECCDECRKMVKSGRVVPYGAPVPRKA
jgi:hypothetical protein